MGVKFGDSVNSDSGEKGALPEVASELSIADKSIGKVTSVVYSLQLKAPLAIAYVRRGNEQPGSELTSPFGICQVVKDLAGPCFRMLRDRCSRLTEGLQFYPRLEGSVFGHVFYCSDTFVPDRVHGSDNIFSHFF